VDRAHLNFEKPPFLYPELLFMMPSDWWVEELKDGSVIAKHSPNKNVCVIGKDIDSCDIVTLHSSVSRNHAKMLVSNGSAFLQDLGSTNGTILNKKPISKNVRCPLFSGDVIRFGASTRLYVFMSDSIHRQYNSQVETEGSIHNAIQMEYNSNVETEEFPLEPRFPFSDDPVIRNLKTKLENLKSQRDSILEKEFSQDILTDGQRKHLDSVENTIIKVEESIRSREVIAPISENKQNKGDMYAVYDNDDAPDIPDRSKEGNNSASFIYTYDSVIAKLNVISGTLPALRDLVAQLEHDANQKHASLEEADSYERYLVENELALEKEKLDKEKCRLAESASEMESLKAIAEQLKPALFNMEVNPVSSSNKRPRIMGPENI